MMMAKNRVDLAAGIRPAPIPGLPNGHLGVAWSGARIAMHEAKDARYGFGLVILAALLGLAAAGLRSR